MRSTDLFHLPPLPVMMWIYPLIALVLAIYVHAAPRQSQVNADELATGESRQVGYNSVPVAAPSMAASPSAVLWQFEEGPLIEFTMRLSQERR
jgi:hypothetical protein